MDSPAQGQGSCSFNRNELEEERKGVFYMSTV